MTDTARALTAADLEHFIRRELAAKLRVSEQDISVDTPFVELGLSSRDAIALIGRLEDHLGFDIEPSVAWDYPTVAGMAAHLTRARTLA